MTTRAVGFFRNRSEQPQIEPRSAGVLLGLLTTSFLGLAACGGTEVKSEFTTATKGQQLIDLKEAQDAGVINGDEYERERQRILKQ